MHRIFDFEHNGINRSIYYKDNYFKINADNLNLSQFVKINPSDKLLVEFGSGLFVIPLLLSCRYDTKMVGIEKDQEACRLSNETIITNNLENQLFVINDYVQNVLDYFKINSVDIVVSNPPYFTIQDQCLVSKEESKTIAKHEVDLTFEDVVNYSNKILKNNGALFLIQRVERLLKIENTLKQYGFAIKRMQFIYPNLKKSAKLVMIEARKNGKEQGLSIMAPLILEGEGLNGK